MFCGQSERRMLEQCAVQGTHAQQGNRAAQGTYRRAVCCSGHTIAGQPRCPGHIQEGSVLLRVHTQQGSHAAQGTHAAAQLPFVLDSAPPSCYHATKACKHPLC